MLTSLRSYFATNRLRLFAALGIIIGLALGAIDPATAALGGLIVCDTSPDELLKKALQEHGSALKTFREGITEEVTALRRQIVELAQKSSGGFLCAGGGGGGGDSTAELADIIVKSEGVAAYLKGNTTVCEIKVPTRLLLQAKTQIVNSSGTAQPLVAADRRPGVVFGPEQRLLAQGLFQRFPTTSNLIEYANEATFTSNARPQGDASPGGIEGEALAESAMTFTLATSPVVTIGHWIPASRQVLSDSAMLQAHLDARLLYGLNLEIEQEILTGDGTAGQLNGLTSQAAAFSGGSTNLGRIDVLATAINQLALGDYEPTAIVLHPSDWLAIRLLKDSQNRYLVGDPASAAPAMLWGLPIVLTSSMNQGNFLCLDSRRWGYICDREDSTIRISESHSDFFVRGLVAILAEARLAFVTERTGAGTYGSLTYAG